MAVRTYAVTGLTCDHCVHAVGEEIGALTGVRDVTVDLNAGGTSRVHVTSERPLSDADVAAALDEAGEYQLV